MPAPRTPSARPRRGVLAALLTGLLAVSALLATAGTASAHDVVTGSDPADGATLPTAPTSVSVTFSDEPQGNLSTLTVVGPDGARHDAGPTTTQGQVVTVPVGPLPQAGRYEIGYRIISSDGHPTTGSVAFELTTPSASSAAPAGTAAAAPGTPSDPHAGHEAAPPSPAAAAGPDDASGGVPAWVFVVIAVVVVGGAVALVLRRRA
ncbi:copper resistance CopC family protein [Actinomycetospora straminea]|uniref:CopC domain-containing protein n=1 Tax=Actinomycetospora straminea TaxID=663607 RepID=A0ABP9EAW2_9PSEU|nr:copper resistance CopC family protein [Actinomycetospora straminea]MDD7935407.1 copper resistance protein CopC [Actinomycetospora straminea]